MSQDSRIAVLEAKVAKLEGILKDIYTEITQHLANQNVGSPPPLELYKNKKH